LAIDGYVADLAVVRNVDVYNDLVAAQRIKSFDPNSRGCGKLATVTWAAVVVEDDLSVEVF